MDQERTFVSWHIGLLTVMSFLGWTVVVGDQAQHAHLQNWSVSGAAASTSQLRVAKNKDDSHTNIGLTSKFESNTLFFSVFLFPHVLL